MSHLVKPPFGIGLYLDGVDDYVECPEIRFGSGSFTLEVWFMGLSYPGNPQMLIGNYKETTTPFWSIYWLTDGRMQSYHRDAGGTASRAEGPVVELGKWYVFHAVKDAEAGENRIYYNGELMDAVSDATGDCDSGQKTYIGLHLDRYVHGVYGEVRAYKRALSDKEISDRCNLRREIRDGLVLKLSTYGLVRGNGTKWLDESPYRNHGTVYGATRVRCCHCNPIVRFGTAEPI